MASFSVYFNPRTNKHFAAEAGSYSLPVLQTVNGRSLAWGIANEENRRIARRQEQNRLRAERTARRDAAYELLNQARGRIWAAEKVLELIADDSTLVEPRRIAEEMLATAKADRTAALQELDATA